MEQKKRKLEKGEKEVVVCGNSTKVIHPFPLENEFEMKKRSSYHAPAKEGDIYVSRKSNHISLLSRGRKMLRKRKEVQIHALGAAIQLGVELALILREEFKDNEVKTEIKTETVKLVDDFISKSGNSEGFSQIRKNSAIHISLKVEK